MSDRSAPLPLAQFIPAGVCMRCQGCCRFREEGSVWSPSLLEDERELLGIPEAKMPLVRDAGTDTWQCRYLQAADTACRIYDRRPFECQLYPFVLNRCGASVFLSLDPQCPYAFEHQQSPSLAAYLDELQRYLELPPVRQRIQRNPQAIQSYEGVINLRKLPL